MPEDIIDLVTGRLLPYHDDEYIRQAAEKLLIQDRGWSRDSIGVEYRRSLTVGGEPFEVRADLALMVSGAPALIMRTARGSLVSREKETIAAARLIFDPIVPFCLVYNGEDAELLESRNGKVLATGLEAVPTPERLAELAAGVSPHHASQDEIQKAAKVYSAFAFIQCPGVCRV
jgi:hypothetical protein